MAAMRTALTTVLLWVTAVCCGGTLLGGCHSQAEEPGAHDEHDHEESESPATHPEESAGEHESPELVLSDTQISNGGIVTEVLTPRALGNAVHATAEVTFHPDRLAKVAAPVAGRVDEVRVTPGMAVESGAVLAVINSPELGQTKGEYLVAQAGVSLAQQNFKREQSLAEANISAKRNLASARVELGRAQSELEGLEERLRGYGMSISAVNALRPGRHAVLTFDLKSPIAGTVLQRNVSIGEGIDTTTILFVVGDTSVVWVEADILERDLSAVSVGQQATIRTEAYPQSFPGTVTYLAPVMEESTRAVHARVEVDNSSGLLRPGMFAHAQIEVGGEESKRLAVPVESVIRRGGETFVFVAEPGGKFVRIEVKLGRKVGTQRVIEGGLESGQSLVVAGAFFLQSEIEKAGFEAGHAH